ncbi:hypothetical protein [Natranaerobius thermophilus]|nr:hypothetical protein [Natranaerobius thermophilus]
MNKSIIAKISMLIILLFFNSTFSTFDMRVITSHSAYSLVANY